MFLFATRRLTRAPIATQSIEKCSRIWARTAVCPPFPFPGEARAPDLATLNRWPSKLCFSLCCERKLGTCWETFWKKTVKTNDTTLRNLTTHSHLSCWKENLWNICFICGKVPTQWKSGKSETHKTEPSAKTNEKKNKLNHKTLVTAHFNSADNENNNT